VAVVLAAPTGWAQQSAAEKREGLIEESIRLPVSIPGTFGDSRVELAGLLIRPAGSGPFPLALINHGSPRVASARDRMTPAGMAPQAREFARRGWAAAVVMRRGYGATGGNWAEDYGGCTSPYYLEAGLASAKDMAGAIASLAQLPIIDKTRIISVGISAGGFGTVALSSLPVPGLVAAINFAGGRGSRGPNDVCSGPSLVRAMARYGEKSRVPQLWVYAENDLYFGPALAKEMHAAFTGAGGKAEFVRAAPFGEDGHGLFSAKGIPEWSPMVDAFLRAQSLPTWSPETLTLANLPFATDPMREAFRNYVAAAGEKAFAVSPSGVFGWRTTQDSTDEARRDALYYCQQSGASCVILFENFQRKPAAF
jgi:dienelactone hydrolase